MRASRWFIPTTLAVALALGGCSDGGHGGGRGGGGGIGAAGMGGGGALGGGGGASGGGSGTGGTGGTGGTTPADGIVVDTPSGRAATETIDGACDLLEAVAAATTGQTVHECANPNGSRRIILAGGGSYPIGKTLRFATAATADHPLQVGIADGTTGNATITATNPWLVDPGDPPTSCLLSASGDTFVELSDVTLTQAPSLNLAGACLTSGWLTIQRGHVTGFRRGGISGTCLPETGCDYNASMMSATATIQVRNSLVDLNTTAGDGGGIYSSGLGATVVVYHSSIVNNTAAGSGGGVYLGGGWNTDVIRGSTISGNSANVGGGVTVKFQCVNTYLNLYNSTITNNTAQVTGGGIQFEPASLDCSRQDVSVYWSIIAGNHAVTTDESNINAGWVTDDQGRPFGIFNCYGGSMIHVAPGLPRPNEIDAPCFIDTRDPRLGPLTPMGGVGDLPAHPLLTGSPAIDAAPTDQNIEDERDGWVPFIDPPVPASDAWMLFDRMVDGNGDGTAAPDFGAIERLGRWQTELLAVADKGAASHQVVTAPAGFDRGAGTSYAATSATNEFVTYRLPIGEPGYYDIAAGVLQTPNGGKLQMAVANDPGGPWTDLGSAQDTFATSPTFASFGPFAGPLFASAGEKYLRFTVAGRNAASGGYQLSLDYIDARRSTKACPIAQLASGSSHTCALTGDGAVRCWGADESGQLGDGKVLAVWRAPAIDTLTGVAAIAAGSRHTCAVTTSGGVRCWGANNAGQLGDGTATSRPAPPASDVLTGVKALAAGANHTCALTTAGGVRCWGSNDAGQLGDGTTMDRSTPPAADILGGVGAIAAGGSVTCALMQQTGGVRCWGANTFGQLGDGTTVDRASPPSTDAIAGVASLSVASGHTCVVTTGGGIRCWGHNGEGELGDGTWGIDTITPPAADVLSAARAVAAGPTFTCALTAAGGVRCWGYNSDGQIGDDTPNAVDRLVPADTDILAGVKAISTGAAHACALMSTTGAVRCWGANAFGQLGDGLAPDSAIYPPPRDIVTFAGTCR